MRSESDDPEAKCPVDHQTREKWLEAARAKDQQKAATPQNAPRPKTPSSLRYSLDTGRWQAPSPPPLSQQNPESRPPKLRRLSTDREISTIPRAFPNADPTSLNHAERAALPPANSQGDTGHDAASGNWIYPSQEMFFKAMERKGHAPQTSDMGSIVPIHNAVNERAWSQILDWEGRLADKCGGPKLVSFSGDSKKLTPRAVWNMWVKGYQRPFDRHDWVVDRCGERVEYVIDFYQGKGMGGLSFHLDVRPKVNSWEGVRMRAAKAFGGV
ncbi:hypothetical protein MBLNU230_g1476t1 [Neophaeotheca triangularis]